MPIPKSAHYRPSPFPFKKCGNCTWLTSDQRCRMFQDTPVARSYVCDEWDGEGQATPADGVDEWDWGLKE